VATGAIDEGLARRLYERANAGRWAVTRSRWTEALAASLSRAFPDSSPPAHEAERYLAHLHLSDLALACACADGKEEAWEHFVTELRPVLYRAAQALDPQGGAREIADALYADLYGFADETGSRRSLFRYYHGRSTLATWLRAVLSQRHVDRFRASRREEPLPEDPSPAAFAATSSLPNPERTRFVQLMEQALESAITCLPARDRLRLGCYYAQGLTLAEVGRAMNEHEATVSRNLTRTRRTLRQEIERVLREGGMQAAEMAECFESVMSDAGPLDLGRMLATGRARKGFQPDRSENEGP
jgi:RNA polymerase sigma-70 factor (ECF subfamily)